MANKFTRFLSGAGSGILNPKGNLGDPRHASRMFVDDAFARAPRTKFLFHVFFEINDKAINSSFRSNHSNTIGMLVKSSTLPRFTFDTDVKNQYNRKKIVYKNINYDPLQITFHDDNTGITNALWAMYLSYYSPEREKTMGAWEIEPGGVNAGDADAKFSGGGTGPYNNGVLTDEANFRYGLDSDRVKHPFFKSITIYTMSKRRFNSYKLVNPHIRTWDHGDVSYAESGGTVQATMNLGFESVLYGAGVIDTANDQQPIAFGDLHYDKVPSPLSILGGGTASLFGPGGILAASGDGGSLSGAEQIFGKENFQDKTPGTIGALQAALGAINFARQLSNIDSGTLTQEALNLALTPNRRTNITSGIPGVSFGNFGTVSGIEGQGSE